MDNEATGELERVLIDFRNSVMVRFSASSRYPRPNVDYGNLIDATIGSIQALIAQQRRQAVEEFAEKLKEQAVSVEGGGSLEGQSWEAVTVAQIDAALDQSQETE